MLNTIKVVLILSALFFLSSCAKLEDNKFKGYLVYDEELIGFFPCGRKQPYGINDNGKIDISAIYQNKKTYIREPIYFEVQAIIKLEGWFGVGLESQPVKEYLQVTAINVIGKKDKLICETRGIPREVELDP